ncbi:hypothetical protein SISSUDRAFT_576236 [Sistotremastrum suecicum HHB10207 ss-3]|uniref:Major facilitator superfamily (MFS) profile domain-containing protein n=1 Tax=Sistotremastrum suecicum HHB10207 ss-3 TaxID=1314776 RepID=A0A165XFQ2_9AGAM|nr:hypothetical protein SISSUDRAFT_576236 [Sistotremastrum suecicum HHB10207 ss-3]
MYLKSVCVAGIIMADVRSFSENNFQSGVLVTMYTYITGYCLGPVIGGALVSVQYRWVFALNLPCSVISMVAWRSVERTTISLTGTTRSSTRFSGEKC